LSQTPALISGSSGVVQPELYFDSFEEVVPS